MAAPLRLDRLDEAQRAAVESAGAPLCILAGPGSGKTRVLTHRIARRAEDGDLDPRRVLALTFTRRAAQQLRSRLAAIGIRDVGAVGTFHSVALAQIRQHRIDNGRRPPAVVGQRRQVLAELLDNRRSVPLGLAAGEIDWAAARALTPDEYLHGPGRRRVGAAMARAVSDLHRDYEQHKRRRGVLDFDDLLLECTRLLRTEPSFRDAQRWLFRHVFVDEFQDLNQTQFNLLQAWVGDRRDLCVVGDADQAIYAWNGADASFLTDFATNYPSTTVVSLETNHRSSAAIVRASDAVLGRAPRTTGRGAEGSPPTITRFESAHEEAVGIARLVRQRRPPGARWRRSAVLTRTNEQLSLISQVFTQLEIPHRLRGQAGMLRIPEVAAVVDQLVDAGPDIATIANDLVEELDDGPARTVAEMANQFVDEDPTAHGSAFRQWLRTFRPNDLDGMYDAVDLVTFHAAKGLEWPHVVVAGLEDGFVPIGDQDEEERRLLFVAVSRAEEQLDLTWAGHRDVGGIEVVRAPSPFLADVEAAATPPPEPPPDRRPELVAAARQAVGPVPDNATQRRIDRLRAWRTVTARARRISEPALIDDHGLRKVAETNPRTLEELAEATGQRPHRLARVGPEILAVLADEHADGNTSPAASR